MKKNWLYLIVFTLLFIAAYFLVFKEKLSTLGKKDTDFELKHPEGVSKIFMADMNGKKILLEKKSEGWILNGKFKAREDAVKNILETFQKVRVFYPVPKSAHNTVVAEMASDNIKVELYDGDGEKIKSYLVGGPTQDYQGTYMMIEGASRPYVVHVPGFEGYMTPRFFLEEEEWRNRNIFSYSAKTLKYVEVDYLEQPENSFKISLVNDDSFEIIRLHASDNIKPGELNKDRIRQYLSFYSNINAEAFENKNSKKDSILSTAPFILMAVTDISGNENKLEIYHMPVNERSKSKFDEQGNPLKYDVDRIYALHNEKDFLLIQYFVFNKLLREYRDFYKGEEK